MAKLLKRVMSDTSSKLTKASRDSETVGVPEEEATVEDAAQAVKREIPETSEETAESALHGNSELLNPLVRLAHFPSPISMHESVCAIATCAP